MSERYLILVTLAFFVFSSFSMRAGAEVGNSVGHFNDQSRFVREFRFVRMSGDGETPCQGSETKYPIGHVYQHEPTRTLLTLFTQRASMLIGGQALTFTFSGSKPDENHRRFSGYFVEESTRGTIPSTSVMPRFEMFIADSQQSRIQDFAQAGFLIRFGIVIIPVAGTAVRSAILRIALPDFATEVPCRS